MKRDQSKDGPDIHLIYAFSHCEAWLEAYARSVNKPANELTSRVGGLLQSQGTGFESGVLSLRGETRSSASEALESLALGGSPRGSGLSYPIEGKKKRVMTKAGLKAISEAQRNRWRKKKAAARAKEKMKAAPKKKNARSGWPASPLARKREMAARQKVAAANKAAKANKVVGES